MTADDELARAITAEQQRQEQERRDLAEQEAVEAAARAAAGKACEAAGGRIYDALEAALARGAGSVYMKEIEVERQIPETVVKRRGLFRRGLTYPAHEGREVETIEAGRECAVVVEIAGDGRNSSRYGYALALEDNGAVSFSVQLSHYAMTDERSTRWGDIIQDYDWVSGGAVRFDSRTAWLEACLHDDHPVTCPNARVADEVITKLAQTLA